KEGERNVEQDVGNPVGARAEAELQVRDVEEGLPGVPQCTRPEFERNETAVDDERRVDQDRRGEAARDPAAGATDIGPGAARLHDAPALRSKWASPSGAHREILHPRVASGSRRAGGAA